MFSLRRSASPLKISAQRIVYGSLPSRGRGYELLGQSPNPGGGPVAEVIAACRRYGQPPGADASRPAWFALRLPAGPWAIIAVDPQGADDQGRPGALIFDAAVISADRLAATGFHVAAFVDRGGAVRWSETPIPATLANLRFEVDHLPSGRSPRAGADDPKVAAIVAAITEGRRVALEAEGPIDDLVGSVWARLPERVRRRSSVATWAFGAENRFDLMAVPRLAGVALDPSYLPPEALNPPAPTGRPVSNTIRPARSMPGGVARAPGSVAVGLGGMALVGVAAVFWASSVRERGRLLPPDPPPAGLDQSGPVDRDEFGPEARARALADLRALGERFEGFDLGDPGDPAAFLGRFADALHYQGPLLSGAELDRLRAAASGSPDAARALRWHEQVRASRDDEPWPARFAELTLPDQLRALGRSFHLGPEVEPGAVPEALMAKLARREAVAPSPLGGEFPALGPYARFLARLPRRDGPAEPGRVGR